VSLESRIAYCSGSAVITTEMAADDVAIALSVLRLLSVVFTELDDCSSSNDADSFHIVARCT